MRLAPNWTRKHETVKRLVEQIETIFDVLRSKGFREGANPVVPAPLRFQREWIKVLKTARQFGTRMADRMFRKSPWSTEFGLCKQTLARDRSDPC